MFKYNDGGRLKAGYKGVTGDCACRAIAIATKISYQEAYDLINEFGKRERMSKRRSSRSSARTGVYSGTMKRIMDHLGWKWTPTMFIGSGCKVHLKADELPKGRLIVNVSKHYTTMINGVINDAWNPDRGGKRCVYGYWSKI